MKKFLKLVLGCQILIFNGVWAQQNTLADPALIETTTQPPTLTGPGATAVTTVVFSNGGFDVIPAHTIRITISLNQYFHYVSPNDITGFEVFFVTGDNSAVTLENTVAFPGNLFTLYPLKINTIAVQPTPAPSGYIASVSRIPAQAGQVGNLSIANDNVAGTIIIGTAIALPLKLLSFTGKSESCNTQLDWKTSDEINVKSFEIEKSLDGINFSALEKMDAKGTGDNAYSIQVSQKEKSVYYRLLMLDKNNAKKYSQVIRVLSNCEDNGFFNVYPNPATTKAPIVLTSSLNELVNYRVMDAASKQLGSGRFQGRSEIRNLIISGTYFIEFQSKTQTKRFKVVVQ